MTQRDIDRRRFLGTLGAAGLGGLALTACGPSAAAADRRLERIGVQLYTIRDRMADDVAGTLRAVADVGYSEVETAGLYELTAEAFRAELDRVGLVSPAGHVDLDACREDLGAALTEAQQLGQSWIVVPYMPETERTAEGYRALADEFNGYGEAAQARGLRFAYHNHDFEFEPLDGDRTGYDILLEETDPSLVDMELDLFWAVKGAHDPVDLFARHPGRFPLCHVKDMADIGGAERMVDVGAGEIDFAGIFTRAEEGGLSHFFVEHDEPQDSLASIEASYQHLEDLDY